MKLISRTLGKQLRVDQLVRRPTVFIVQNELRKDFPNCTKYEFFHEGFLQ